ncbi:MAG TPA: hypothetical protein VN802_19105 [Stellaceae bacterium]|nr:hypothetical protein [Stellaceae bacterium]
MSLEFRHDAETAASLIARAERCRALSRVAYLPFAAGMLLALAQQLEGEAERFAHEHAAQH